MRAPNYKVYDIHVAKDLQIGMRVAFNRDIGGLHGTIEELSNIEGIVTIIIEDIVTDPEERSFYPPKTKIHLNYPEDKQIKVKVPLTEILKNL